MDLIRIKEPVSYNCILLCLLIFINQVFIVNSNSIEEDSTHLDTALKRAESHHTSETHNGSSGYFTLISGIPPEKPQSGKHRRVVKRRRKKVPSTPSITATTLPPVITTLLPHISSSTEPAEGVTKVTMSVSYSDDPNEAVPNFKPHHKKKAHVHKVPEIWKILNENEEVLPQKGKLKVSNIDKRESTENKGIKNTPANSEENHSMLDMHSEESSNSYVNTSTPISNELQNSLQFTLQFLHPLLNSDSVVSENSPKIPENKTVGLDHTLSDSVAQTPVAHDLGFLPTHLKKKHPLLNEDSIFSTDNGVSKTGVRTNNDVKPVATSTENPDKTGSNTGVKDGGVRIQTSVSVSSSPNLVTQLPSTTRATPRTTKTPATQKPTTSRPPSTTTVTTPRTTTTARTTSTTRPTTVKTEMTPPQVFGVLNITEVTSTSGVPAEEVASATIPSHAHPPLFVFPVNDKPTPDNSQWTTAQTTTLKPDQGSQEVSSAEQMLVEQLLGIGSGSQEAENPNSSAQGDSNEQLVKLFNNLVQGQIQNQGKPSTAFGNTGASQNTNAVLQSLIESSLKSQNQQQDFSNLFGNLGSFLSSPSTQLPASPSFTTSTPLLPPSQGTSGLSDADLKSIFALLDNQPPSSTTLTAPSSTTTTTITTTPRPTTPTVAPTSNVFTTTLHPALQNMLDLFNNQLKPFQSIPSSSATLLQNLNPIPTSATTVTPTKSPTVVTTLNSLDILSQLLNFGGGNNKVNPVRSTPPPDVSLASIFAAQNPAANRPAQSPEFSLASIFGQQNLNPTKPNPTPDFSLASIFGKNNNIFPSNIQSPPGPAKVQEQSAPSESNQHLNFFGGQPSNPPGPTGLYYWLDMNAFLGGDPKADGMAGIRPKIGNKYPFIKV